MAFSHAPHSLCMCECVYMYVQDKLTEIHRDRERVCVEELMLFHDTGLYLSGSCSLSGEYVRKQWSGEKYYRT